MKRELSSLPNELVQNLRYRIEQGSRNRWQASADLWAELFEWLPESRALRADGTLNSKLLHAAFGQLARHMTTAQVPVFLRLLAAVALVDAELLARARTKLKQHRSFSDAIGARLAGLETSALSATSSEAAVVAAFRCAALGFDGEPMQELLGALLRSWLRDRPEANADAHFLFGLVAQLCWACAEVRAHTNEAANLAASFAGQYQGISDPLSCLRLAWGSLVCGADSTVEGLLNALVDFDGDHLLAQLTPVDKQPAQQLAWHAQRQGEGFVGDWVQRVLDDGRGSRSRAATTGQSALVGDKPERHLSGLLQEMRVPHVMSTPAAVPGGYGKSIWFPQPKAVLDVGATGDRLMSGKLRGAAELRRQQLRSAGLHVHAVDAKDLSDVSRPQQLHLVAHAVAESCPEAVDWLSEAEADNMSSPLLEKEAA